MIEDHKWQYTWLQDFAIASAFGKNAVIDTAKRAFNEWKDNVDAMMEFVAALNLHCWHNYYAGNEALMLVYRELYYKYNDLCLDKFEGEELKKYWEFLD